MSVLVAEFCMCRDSVARDWAAKSCKIIIKGQERKGQQDKRERKEQINGKTDKGSSSKGVLLRPLPGPFAPKRGCCQGMS